MLLLSTGMCSPAGRIILPPVSLQKTPFVFNARNPTSTMNCCHNFRNMVVVVVSHTVWGLRRYNFIPALKILFLKVSKSTRVDQLLKDIQPNRRMDQSKKSVFNVLEITVVSSFWGSCAVPLCCSKSALAIFRLLRRYL